MQKKTEAKKKMLKELKKMMRDDHYEPMKGDMKKKVTVVADSDEGLKEGLSKAEQIMEMKENSCKKEDEDDYSHGGMKKQKKK